MSILTKQQICDRLYSYYVQYYGERENDIWYEQSAVNVWVFAREGKIITLQYHVLTGAITQNTEDIAKVN